MGSNPIGRSIKGRQQLLSFKRSTPWTNQTRHPNKRLTREGCFQVLREGTGIVEVRCGLCPGQSFFGEPFFDAFPEQIGQALLIHRKRHGYQWEPDSRRKDISG